MAAAAVAAMNARPDSVTAQRSGCSELIELATGASGAQAIVNAGGVAAVVAAMRQHTEDAELQDYGCSRLQQHGCAVRAAESRP